MQLTLIDLSSLAHPIWHMAASDPNPNATADQIVARVRSLATEHTAICCDSGKSFRNDVSPDYKANRKPEERETLYHQINLALERLRADGFPIWAAKGFEADDVIATAATMAWHDRHDVLIVSSDKDLLQLVCDVPDGSGAVMAKSLINGQVLDEAAVYEKFKVQPRQMKDYLTIVGDAADNIKGVVGVGEKGAADLLARFESLDWIYANLPTLHADKTVKPSQVLALQAFHSRLATVRELVTLRTDAPIEFGEILVPRDPQDVPVMGPMPELEPIEPDDIDDVFMVPEADLIPEPEPETPEPPPAPAAPGPPQRQAVVRGPVTVMKRDVDIDWKAQLEPRSLNEAIFIADRAFESRLFSAYGTPQAVLMTILAGRELGLSAMASLRAIHIIDGKPTVSADLMRAQVLKSGAAKFFRCTERTDTYSTWQTQRGDDPPMSITVTMEDARAAGVIKPNSGWVKYPADMLVARASAKLARLVYPDILHGIYTPEELREAQ